MRLSFRISEDYFAKARESNRFKSEIILCETPGVERCDLKPGGEIDLNLFNVMKNVDVSCDSNRAWQNISRGAVEIESQCEIDILNRSKIGYIEKNSLDIALEWESSNDHHYDHHLMDIPTLPAFFTFRRGDLATQRDNFTIFSNWKHSCSRSRLPVAVLSPVECFVMVEAVIVQNIRTLIKPHNLTSPDVIGLFCIEYEASERARVQQPVDGIMMIDVEDPSNVYAPSREISSIDSMSLFMRSISKVPRQGCTEGDALKHMLDACGDVSDSIDKDIMTGLVFKDSDGPAVCALDWSVDDNPLDVLLRDVSVINTSLKNCSGICTGSWMKQIKSSDVARSIVPTRRPESMDDVLRHDDILVRSQAMIKSNVDFRRVVDSSMLYCIVLPTTKGRGIVQDAEIASMQYGKAASILLRRAEKFPLDHCESNIDTCNYGAVVTEIEAGILASLPVNRADVEKVVKFGFEELSIELDRMNPVLNEREPQADVTYDMHHKEKECDAFQSAVKQRSISTIAQTPVVPINTVPNIDAVIVEPCAAPFSMTSATPSIPFTRQPSISKPQLASKPPDNGVQQGERTHIASLVSQLMNMNGIDPSTVTKNRDHPKRNLRHSILDDAKRKKVVESAPVLLDAAIPKLPFNLNGNCLSLATAVLNSRHCVLKRKVGCDSLLPLIFMVVHGLTRSGVKTVILCNDRQWVETLSKYVTAASKMIVHYSNSGLVDPALFQGYSPVRSAVLGNNTSAEHRAYVIGTNDVIMMDGATFKVLECSSGKFSVNMTQTVGCFVTINGDVEPDWKRFVNSYLSSTSTSRVIVLGEPLGIENVEQVTVQIPDDDVQWLELDPSIVYDACMTAVRAATKHISTLVSCGAVESRAGLCSYSKSDIKVLLNELAQRMKCAREKGELNEELKAKFKDNYTDLNCLMLLRKTIESCLLDGVSAAYDNLKSALESSDRLKSVVSMLSPVINALDAARKYPSPLAQTMTSVVCSSEESCLIIAPTAECKTALIQYLRSHLSNRSVVDSVNVEITTCDDDKIADVTLALPNGMTAPGDVLVLTADELYDSKPCLPHSDDNDDKAGVYALRCPLMRAYGHVIILHSNWTKASVMLGYVGGLSHDLSSSLFDRECCQSAYLSLLGTRVTHLVVDVESKFELIEQMSTGKECKPRQSLQQLLSESNKDWQQVPLLTHIDVDAIEDEPVIELPETRVEEFVIEEVQPSAPEPVTTPQRSHEYDMPANVEVEQQQQQPVDVSAPSVSSNDVDAVVQEPITQVCKVLAFSSVLAMTDVIDALSVNYIECIPRPTYDGNPSIDMAVDYDSGCFIRPVKDNDIESCKKVLKTLKLDINESISCGYQHILVVIRYDKNTAPCFDVHLTVMSDLVAHLPGWRGLADVRVCWAFNAEDCALAVKQFVKLACDRRIGYLSQVIGTGGRAWPETHETCSDFLLENETEHEKFLVRNFSFLNSYTAQRLLAEFSLIDILTGKAFNSDVSAWIIPKGKLSTLLEEACTRIGNDSSRKMSAQNRISKPLPSPAAKVPMTITSTGNSHSAPAKIVSHYRTSMEQSSPVLPEQPPFVPKLIKYPKIKPGIRPAEPQLTDNLPSAAPIRTNRPMNVDSASLELNALHAKYSKANPTPASVRRVSHFKRPAAGGDDGNEVEQIRKIGAVTDPVPSRPLPVPLPMPRPNDVIMVPRALDTNVEYERRSMDRDIQNDLRYYSPEPFDHNEQMMYAQQSFVQQLSYQQPYARPVYGQQLFPEQQYVQQPYPRQQYVQQQQMQQQLYEQQSSRNYYGDDGNDMYSYRPPRRGMPPGINQPPAVPRNLYRPGPEAFARFSPPRDGDWNGTY